MRKNPVLTLIVSMALITLTGCGYNTMQKYEEAVFGAWGNVESSLQRRADLIPNLVETVKGYAAHEKETLQAVIEARSKATSVKLSAKDLSNAEVVERYPDLKANQNFLALQDQLEGTENRINVARQRYNQAVERFNFAIRKFPNNLTNNLLLNLERKEYFKAEEGTKKAPQVKF
jgi:LemA protein